MRQIVFDNRAVVPRSFRSPEYEERAGPVLEQRRRACEFACLQGISRGLWLGHVESAF